MVNSVTMVGRIVRDPELRYTPSGVAVARFTLAVARPFKNHEGEVETDFVNCVAWRKSAEFLAQYGEKGRLTGIEGRLQIRNWIAPDGSKRRLAEIVVGRVQFLDPKTSAPRATDPERAKAEATLFAS